MVPRLLRWHGLLGSATRVGEARQRAGRGDQGPPAGTAVLGGAKAMG